MPYTTTAPSADSAVVPAAPSDLIKHITVIKQQYKANDWHCVESYLQADLSSADLLVEATRHLRRIFGEGAQVLLDITRDPTGVDHPFLYARVWTGEKRHEVSRKLHQFDEEWWLEASARVDARLEFAIAAQPIEEKAVAI